MADSAANQRSYISSQAFFASLAIDVYVKQLAVSELDVRQQNSSTD